jgi:transposase-like protein
MSTQISLYRGYRFLPEIITYAVWFYHRFCLSFRDVEELLAEREITVSYEAVRQWCLKFGPSLSKLLRHRQGRPGDTWYLDEVFVTIRGTRHYLWRAVDQDGEVLDILVQKRQDQQAAKRFFCKRQQTPKFQRLYRQRAGIEETISQAVNARGMRHSCYIGLAKTHLQHLLTAAAINLTRVLTWWQEIPRQKRRPAPFSALAPAICG